MGYTLAAHLVASRGLARRVITLACASVRECHPEDDYAPGFPIIR